MAAALLGARGAGLPGRPTRRWIDDDEQLLILLVTTWALQSGRIPPSRPPDQLGAAELIAFWADERTATGNPPAAAKE